MKDDEDDLFTPAQIMKALSPAEIPRSRRKAIGACASTPVLSSPWGASLLAPAATGAGLRLLSEDAPPPNFPARLGLHLQK
jgi:hypothetical protein